MKTNKRRMTERQYRAWPEAVLDVSRRLEALGAYPPGDPDDWRWAFHWDEETRPGRGHDLAAVYLDGEALATIRMDVYGSWSTATGEVDWVHTESDECTCPPCTEQRKVEEAAWR